MSRKRAQACSRPGCSGTARHGWVGPGRKGRRWFCSLDCLTARW